MFICEILCCWCFCHSSVKLSSVDQGETFYPSILAKNVTTQISTMIICELTNVTVQSGLLPYKSQSQIKLSFSWLCHKQRAQQSNFIFKRKMNLFLHQALSILVGQNNTCTCFRTGCNFLVAVCDSHCFPIQSVDLWENAACEWVSLRKPEG